MLLTVTRTVEPAEIAAGADASDLGFLLHKHPDKVQTFTLPFGEATVFYPEVSAERCTAALLLTIDPIGLVRGSKGRKRAPEAFALAQYVNDRPYAASSLLAVAMGRVFNTALGGRCEARPELADTPLTLDLHIPALPARAAAGFGASTGGGAGPGSANAAGVGGAALIRALFEPLGWQVETTAVPLAGENAGFDWGAAPYVDTHLRGRVRLADALSHLYVLLPVLDDTKHYWVGPDEVDKLIRRGAGWLADHPLRDLVTRRYLAAQRTYVRDATARLDELDDRVESVEPDELGDESGAAEASPGDAQRGVHQGDTGPGDVGPGSGADAGGAGTSGVAPGAAAGSPAPAGGSYDPSAHRAPLKAVRREAVLDALRELGAHRVVDLGCGEGYYLQELLADASFTEVVGVDVAASYLARAEKRLGVERGRLSDRQRERLTLRQSSVTYRDDALTGYDAVLLVEVIEHLESDRLPSLERNVFGFAAPRSVIVTTPDADYNSHYDLGEHEMRHPDHRFEWNRTEFAQWAHAVAAQHGYAVAFRSIGGPAGDAPTQMALFTRETAA